MKEKFLWITMILVLVFNCIVYPIYATSKEDLEDEEQEYKKKVTEAEEQHEMIEEQLSTTMKEISKINESISIVQEEINTLSVQIETLEEEIHQKQEEIEQKEKEHKDNTELMEERLVVMYEAGETTFLDLLFNSESIIDFISSYYTLSQITQCDKELLESIEKVQREIEENKKILEGDKEKLDSVKNEKISKNNILNSQKKEREKVASQLSEEEKMLQSEIDDYNEKVSKIENQIREIMRREQQRQSYEEAEEGENFDGSFIWPCDNKVITSGCKRRWGRWHKGIDIGARYVPVYASASGYAYTLENPGGYGHYILIVHGDGWCTLYGHLDSYNVSYGEYVSRGEVIATSGNTGSSQAPHLHFEIRRANNLSSYFSANFLNPIDYLPGGWTATYDAFIES